MRAIVMRLGLGVGLAVGLAPLAACWDTSTTDPNECMTQRDCADGKVCTRVHLCEYSTEVYSLRVEWTVRGQTTDQVGACDGIGEIAMGIADTTTGDDFWVSPVPCGPGSFFYDKLPLSYTSLTMRVFDSSGGFLETETGSAVGSGGVISLSILE
jgi:hypothetical protein